MKWSCEGCGTNIGSQVETNLLNSHSRATVPLTKVAGWYFFKPKIPIWDFFFGWGLAMAEVGIFYGHSVYFIWYNLLPFGIFSTFW
jgi:hypothetical protein